MHTWSYFSGAGQYFQIFHNNFKIILIIIVKNKYYKQSAMQCKLRVLKSNFLTPKYKLVCDDVIDQKYGGNAFWLFSFSSL